MTSRHSNRALSTTRRWTAGVLLASTLAVGGLGLHLADSYAASVSSTVVASGSAAPTTTRATGTKGTTGSSATSSGSSGFGAVGSLGSSSGSGTTTTKGS